MCADACTSVGKAGLVEGSDVKTVFSKTGNRFMKNGFYHLPDCDVTFQIKSNANLYSVVHHKQIRGAGARTRPDSLH